MIFCDKVKSFRILTSNGIQNSDGNRKVSSVNFMHTFPENFYTLYNHFIRFYKCPKHLTFFDKNSERREEKKDSIV